MECIRKAVGITDSQVLPFYSSLSDDTKEAIAESVSGLYITNLAGGIDLNTITDLKYMNDVLAMALGARDEAERVFNDDLVVAISSRFQSTRPKFHGDIGRTANSKTLNVGKQYIGHRYRAIAPISGSIKIEALRVNVNASATFNVLIGRCDVGETEMTEKALHTIPVTSVAGTWTSITLPDGVITLPLQVEGVAQEYYIYYDRVGASVLPKNNEIKCGTCNGGIKIDALGQFIEYHGMEISNLDKVRQISTNRNGYGLCVTAQVACDNKMLLCREYEKKDTINAMSNWALMYKAGELWIEYLMKSNYINKTALQNREYLWGKRNHFRAEYEKRITNIANDMTLGETGCYTCKGNRGAKGTIYS